MIDDLAKGRDGRIAAATKQVPALSVLGFAASWQWYIPEKRLVGDLGFATLHGLDPAVAERGVAPAQFFQLIHPQDRDRIRLAVGGMLRGAEVFSKEFR